MKKSPAINDLLKVMARLRAPDGCPWDREQDHRTLRRHAIEEVYELIDAIEAGDDHEMAEELGDLLMQVVFHCQLARERGAFDFEKVCRMLVDKLVRRHPHVFGRTKVKDVTEVWANWEKIKKAEKHGTKHARHSAFDGIPKHLPALLRAEKLVKKARKAGLFDLAAGRRCPPSVAELLRRTGRAAQTPSQKSHGRAAARPYQKEFTKPALARELFDLAGHAQAHGWSAEELLCREIKQRERELRKQERRSSQI